MRIWYAFKVPISSSFHHQLPNFSTIAIEKTLISDHYYIYNHLRQTCLQQCKRIQSRRLFVEMPQRLSQASKTSKIVHAQSLKFGFRSDAKLGNVILDLYAKCGNLDFAEKLFSRLEFRDVLAWNSVMSMYSKHGSLDLVIQSFVSLRKCDIFPNQFTYAIVLSTCARLKIVGLGKQVHCNVIKTGFELNSFCEGSLIDMYAKCGYLIDARYIFDRVVGPDMVSWTAMIGGYIQIGAPEEALKIFEKMQKLGHVPDQVAFVTVMNAFVSLGRLNDAHSLFLQMPNPNSVAWNVMISGHAKNGNEIEAVDFFRKMRKENVKATRSTYGSVLSAIANLEALHYGLLVQAEATKQGLDSNVYVGSSLINMYAKCEKMEDAKKVFDRLEDKNVILWNSMLGGYVQNGYALEVMNLFFEMRDCGFNPDEYTYTSILSACGTLEYLELGRQFHSYIIKNKFSSNLFVGNSLVDMYAKTGSIKEARKQFERIKNRDKISWNAMIVGYVQEEDELNAFNLFRRMYKDEIAPDEVCLASILSACANLQALQEGKQVHCFSIKFDLETSLYCGSSLIDMYAKSEEIGAAHAVFSRMPHRSVVSMNALIAGYAKIDMGKSVILFRQMQMEGLNPSEVTFACLLDVCNDPHMLNLGTQLHCSILKKGILYNDEFLCVSLLSMYMNSTKNADAVDLFSELPNPKSTVLWTVLLSGHLQNGFHEEALQIYREMRENNATPDQATFASVLKACAISASLVHGKTTHSLIFRTSFDRDELTCSALVDMYAKCGDMIGSTQVFKEMGSNKNDVISWNSMIVGFAKNGFAENALNLFHEMMEKNIVPDEVTFLGVLTACSHAGKVSEGRKIFNIMVNDYHINPRMDHCACMVDLLGRWGFTKEAEEFIERLRFAPDAMIWSTLLGACSTHGDEVRGLRAAEKLFQMDPESSAAYILLANIYAKSGSWNSVNSVRRAMKEKRVKKLPGCSWIEVGNKTHLFVAGDKFHLDSNAIYGLLDDLKVLMKDDDED